MKIISGIIGLVIFFYICFLPIYVLFYNSSKDAVEDLSLASNTENFIKIESKYGRSMTKDEAKRLLKDFEAVKDKYLDMGNDLSKPLYKILKENKNVTDLKIVDVNREEFGMMGSLVNSKAGGEMYVIRCKINGNKFELPVLVIPPSFFRVRSAVAWTPDENVLRSFYFRN